MLKLNENVDLELKPLKALRQQIKEFRQKQYDDIYNQYKKKDGVQSEATEDISGTPVVEVKSKEQKEKPSYYFKGIKKFDKMLTPKSLMLSDLGDKKDSQETQEKIAKCFQMRV